MFTNRIDNDMNNNMSITPVTSTKTSTKTSTTTKDNYKELKDFYHDMNSLCQASDIKGIDDEKSVEYCNQVILMITQFMKQTIPDWQKTYAALMMSYALCQIAKLNIKSVINNSNPDQALTDTLHHFHLATEILETHATSELIEQIAFDTYFEQLVDQINACLDEITKKLFILIHDENVFLDNINPGIVDQKLQSQFKLFNETPAPKLNKDNSIDTTPESGVKLNSRL